MRASQAVRRALNQLPRTISWTSPRHSNARSPQSALRSRAGGGRATARGTVREQIASLARRARLGLPPETATEQPHGIAGPTAREA